MPKIPSKPDDASEPDGLTAPSVPGADESAPSLQRRERAPVADDVNRVIPNSPEAECGVLSCMMQDPNTCIGEATIKIGERQFYDQGRRLLYSIMVELHDASLPVDLISLTTVLKDRKLLEKVGGPAELVHLMRYAPSATQFNYYAKVLRNKFVLRQIIETSQGTIERCYDGGHTVDGLLDGYEAEVLAIREGLEQKEEIKPIRDHLMDAIHQIEHLSPTKAKRRGFPRDTSISTR